MDRLRHREDGATMVEYALMLLFVVLAAFVGVELFGGSVRGLFDGAATVYP